jgi:hypothetical protein
MPLFLAGLGTVWSQYVHSEANAGRVIQRTLGPATVAPEKPDRSRCRAPCSSRRHKTPTSVNVRSSVVTAERSTAGFGVCPGNWLRQRVFGLTQQAKRKHGTQRSGVAADARWPSAHGGFRMSLDRVQLAPFRLLGRCDSSGLTPGHSSRRLGAADASDAKPLALVGRFHRRAQEGSAELRRCSRRMR